MAKVLIADANSAQNMTMGLALIARGHSVQMETSGRGTLDIGMRFRPDVLVVDSQLNVDAKLDGPIDGLEVSGALKVVWGELRTVLTSSDRSQGLLRRARDAQLAAFFNKPLQLEQIDAAIKDAHGSDSPPAELSIAFMEVDPHGTIVYANPKARQYLELPDVRLFRRTLIEVFKPRSVEAIDHSGDNWIRLTRPEAESYDLLGRVRKTSVSRLILLLRRDEEKLKTHSLVSTLAG